MKQITVCKNEKGEELCKQILDLDNNTSILICKGDGSWNLIQYNKNGDKLYDANSKSPNITSYEYDENGNLVKKTDLLSGKSDKYKYDKNNNMIYRENKNGGWRKYEYDNNKLIGGSTSNGGIIHVEYNEEDNSMKEYIEYEDGHRNTRKIKKFDEKGRVISLKYGKTIFEYEYDENDNIIKSSILNTKYTYKDKNGEEKEANDAITTYKYNSNGDKIYSEDNLGYKRFYEISYED